MLRLGVCCALLLLCWLPRARADQTVDQVAPYPGPAPTRFESAQAYGDYVDLRVQKLRDRELALATQLRPRHYRAQLGAALLMLGLGAASAGGAFMLAFSDPHPEGRELRMRRGLGGLGISLSLVGGAYALILRDRHKRGGAPELEQLRAESYYWRNEARRMHPERPVGLLSQPHALELRLGVNAQGLLVHGSF